MKLLVIEDDNEILKTLKGLFLDEGFDVLTASSGNIGLYYSLEYSIDIAIVDLVLPEIGGIDIIKDIRSHNIDFPIIILSKRSRWQYKVEGLEAGADDYIEKPFHSEELKARVKAAIRRIILKKYI